MRCPYVDGKVYCNRRENDDEDSRYACDSCIVLFSDMYGDVDEKVKE